MANLPCKEPGSYPIVWTVWGDYKAVTYVALRHHGAQVSKYKVDRYFCSQDWATLWKEGREQSTFSVASLAQIRAEDWL